MGLTHVSDRWDKLNNLFHEASALPAEQRDAFCRTACGDDHELLALLGGLLASAQVEVEDDELHREIRGLAKDVALTETTPGERIGNYRVDELLAHGGMGDVFLASRADGEFEKTVAIKIVRKRLNAGEFVRHFRTERQVLANLSHRCIPALIDAGQTEDGRPYFVCEFIDGAAIDDYCRNESASTTRRIQLLTEVGEALQHAHNNLVLHLDIKPDNILVDRSGTPRLLDFGVARLMSESDKGHQAFTPEYASPEQIRGESLSTASDVYSLGLLLYRLLAHELPVAAPHPATAATKLADRERFSQALNQPGSMRGIAPDLRAIVRKATAEAPAERYASVAAMLQDLTQYRLHRPVAARNLSAGYRFGKFLRRNAVLVSVVAVAIATLVAFGLREAELRRQAEARSLPGVDASEQVELLVKVGGLLLRNGEPDESERYLARALAIGENNSTLTGHNTAVARYRLGEVYRQRGELKAAEQQTLAAIAELRVDLPADHEHRIISDWQLARVYRDQGRYAEAAPVYAQAFERWQARRPAGDPELAVMAADYASFLRLTGHAEQAESLKNYQDQ